MTSSQANFDPDSDKVLLHTVLMSNGIHTDVPRTDGSHWIYDRHYGPYALWRTVLGKSLASVTTLWLVVQLLALLTLLLRLISNCKQSSWAHSVILSAAKDLLHNTFPETSFRGCLFFCGRLSPQVPGIDACEINVRLIFLYENIILSLLFTKFVAIPIRSNG